MKPMFSFTGNYAICLMFYYGTGTQRNIGSAALHSLATRWRVAPVMVLVLQCAAADYSKGFLGISVTLIKAAGTSSSSFGAATA